MRRSKFFDQFKPGDVIGRWTVTGEPFHQRVGKKNVVFVPCQCSCGNRYSVRAVALDHGKSQGCSACGWKSGSATYRRIEHEGEIYNAKQFADLIGRSPTYVRSQLDQGKSAEDIIAHSKTIESRERLYLFNGEYCNLTQLAEFANISRQALTRRLDKGIPLEKAMSIPPSPAYAIDENGHRRLCESGWKPKSAQWKEQLPEGSIRGTWKTLTNPYMGKVGSYLVATQCTACGHKRLQKASEFERGDIARCVGCTGNRSYTQKGRVPEKRPVKKAKVTTNRGMFSHV